MGLENQYLTILETVPFKDYTVLSYAMLGIGFALMVLSVIYLACKSKHIGFHELLPMSIVKPFAITFCAGLIILITSFIKFPCYYKETGDYEYVCLINDENTMKYVYENYDIVDAIGDVYTIIEKKE